MVGTKMEVEDDTISSKPIPERQSSKRCTTEHIDLKTRMFAKKIKSIFEELERIDANTEVEVLLQVQHTSDFADKRIIVTEFETLEFDRRLLNITAVKKMAYFRENHFSLTTKWEVAQSELPGLPDFQPTAISEARTLNVSAEPDSAGTEQPQNRPVTSQQNGSPTLQTFELGSDSLYSSENVMDREDRSYSRNTELGMNDTGVQVKEEVLRLFTDDQMEDAPSPPEGFDTISPGIFGLNKKELTRQSLIAVKDFLSSHKEQFGLMIFDRFDDNALKLFEEKMNEHFPPDRAAERQLNETAENGKSDIGTGPIIEETSVKTSVSEPSAKKSSKERNQTKIYNALKFKRKEKNKAYYKTANEVKLALKRFGRGKSPRKATIGLSPTGETKVPEKQRSISRLSSKFHDVEENGHETRDQMVIEECNSESADTYFTTSFDLVVPMPRWRKAFSLREGKRFEHHGGIATVLRDCFEDDSHSCRLSFTSRHALTGTFSYRGVCRYKKCPAIYLFRIKMSIDEMNLSAEPLVFSVRQNGRVDHEEVKELASPIQV